MQGIVILRWLNPLLLISVLVQAVTGAVLYFHLFASRPEALEVIAEIHEQNGLVLIVLAGLHIVLNWGWFRVQFSRKK